MVLEVYQAELTSGTRYQRDQRHDRTVRKTQWGASEPQRGGWSTSAHRGTPELLPVPKSAGGSRARVGALGVPVRFALSGGQRSILSGQRLVSRSRCSG